MRILYGITGEGLGHTMRARVLIEHLASQGHTLQIAASGRALEVLRHRHDGVAGIVPIQGLSLVYAQGQLERVATIRRNGRAAPRALVRNVRAAAAVIDFDPDVVVSDFDSFSYILGRVLDRPVVSVDHQHVLSRFQHSPRVLRDLSYDFPLVCGVVDHKMRDCARYIVTSFFFPTVRNECAGTTRLVGPIVRPELESLTPSEGEHVLVYQTGTGDVRLLEMLNALSQYRFVVYGAAARPASPHVTYRPFSEAGFLDELSSARAVISNGGYTTLSEAACLGKPVLSIPIRHQGEQELNAAYLEEEGLGIGLRRPSVRTIRERLDVLLSPSRPRRRLRSATNEARRAVVEAIDEAVREVA